LQRLENLKLHNRYYFIIFIIIIIIIIIIILSRGGADGIAIAAGDGLDGQGSIPGKGKIFIFSTASKSALGPTQPPLQWVPGAIFPGVKRPGLQADNLPSSRAEVKNVGAIHPLPHIFTA
jgi:hypothetical protein